MQHSTYAVGGRTYTEDGLYGAFPASVAQDIIAHYGEAETAKSSLEDAKESVKEARQEGDDRALARAEAAERIALAKERQAASAIREAERLAEIRRRERTDAASDKKDAAKQKRRQAAVGKHTPSIYATSAISESPDTRFLDAVIAVGVSATTVIWTATRPATAALGWAAFWTGLGGLMLVEAKGNLLKYGGAGLAAGNGAYIALRIAQLAKTEPNQPVP